MNRAQHYIHERLEAQLKETGKVRAIILKGRQQGCCFAQHMRVLTSDYRWIQIKDVKVGDSLYALDEEPISINVNGRKTDRKICLATIEAKVYFKKQAFEVCLSNGVKLEVTGDHRMLFRQRGGCLSLWRDIDSAVVGDYIRSFSCPPQDYEPTYEDGWFAGLLDGEGSFGCYPAARIALSQVEGAVLQRAKKYLEDRGIRYYELVDKRIKCGQRNKMGDKPVHCIRIDRQADIIKILTMTRPSRFVARPEFVGKSLPNSCDGFESWVKIESIRSIGEIEVVDLQTSAKTFICEGLVSHNSTYVQARYFHKTITNRGIKTFILTHEGQATKNLFEMTKRYYEYLPQGLCPKANRDSQKELKFETIDSGYAIGTAGAKGTGRSQTVQLLHGSEVAHWPNAAEHAQGLFQAVGDQNNTEIILESTANGIGNFFHQSWVSAEQGRSDFQAIFVPWYWQPEYTAYYNQKAEEIYLSDEEQALLDAYKHNGMTREHIYWRRFKIGQFSSDHDVGVKLFNQEYPTCAHDAFLNPVEDTFINSTCVTRARKNHVEISKTTPLIIGVDPAIGDNDRCAIIKRKGRVAYDLETVRNYNTMELAGKLKTMIDREKPSKVFIDCIGIGAGVVDRLQEMGYSCVEGINVARTANNKEIYANLRAELWGEMRDWLTGELPVQIPDSEELHADLCSLGYKHRSNGQLLIESKQDLKARGMPSCDLADALMITFAMGQYVGDATYQPNFMPIEHRGMFT